MKADVTIPVCPCGGARTRVSTQPVYRCPDCGDVIHRRGGEWKQRSEHTSFSKPRNPDAKHVAFPTVGMSAPQPRIPHRSTRTLAYLAQRVYSKRTES